MSWLASLFIAVLTGGLGLVLAGVIANACVGWYRISSFEGKAGYFVVFMALLGGVAALVIGLVTARAVAAGESPGFFKGLGLACGITLVVAGCIALAARLMADIPPTIEGDELDLEVEIRLPVGETNAPSSATGKSFLRLGSLSGKTYRKSEMGELHLTRARLEEGRWILPGSVFLFTQRGNRLIDADLDGKSIAGFLVPLPSKPGQEHEQWSEWLPRPRPGDPPWPDTKALYRFRVVRRTPSPPEPDPVEIELQKFAALKPDAPLAEWLAFLDENGPEERNAAVMNVVEQRPADLAAAIRSTDEATREHALSAVTKLKTVTPEISDVVRAEGRDIAEGIRRFNEMKEDDPRFYDVQLDLRSRFSYWHRAWWTVHQRTGIDGRPPVQEIHDLAQVRSKGTSMDEIVVRARAHLDGLPAPEKQP